MLLAAAGCGRTWTPEGASGPMVFSGAASEEAETRAFFPGTGVDMNFSDYDNIGAYMYDASDVYVKSDFCKIDNILGGDADFEPVTLAERKSWTSDQAGATDATEFKFRAYYPEPTGAAKAYDASAMAFSVPAEQDGEFGKYQICCSGAVTKTKKQIEDGEEIKFAFSPATSMLRTQLTLTAESDVDEVYIKKFVVKTTGQPIAGPAGLDLEAGTLAPKATGTSKTITVEFATPVKITKDASTNPFIEIVILPGAAAEAKVLSFTAYTVTGLRIALFSKNTPVTGFDRSRRYNLERAVTVLKSFTPDAYYNEGGDAWGTTIVNDAAYTDGGTAW